MNDHLTDGQIAAEVAGLDLGADERRHLSYCLACRASVEEMRRLIETRRLQLTAGEPDWQAQRQAVVAAVDGAPSGRSRRWWAPALAAAAAVVVAAVVALEQQPGDGGSRREIAVEEVLAEADTLLNNDSIPGFELIDPGLDEIEDFPSGDAADGGTL
jgi:hypothetical protein